MHTFHLALRVLNGLRDHLVLDGHVFGDVRFLHHGGNAVQVIAAKQAHQVIFQRDVELRGTGVALTARTTTQLIVNTTRLVALGTDNRQTTCGNNLVVLACARLFRFFERSSALLFVRVFGVGCTLFGELSRIRIEPVGNQHIVHQDIGVAAQQDVGTAACHVRGDGHGAQTACLRDNLRFTLVILRVQDFVLDAATRKRLRQTLGALNGHRTNQARLTSSVTFLHFIGNGAVLRGNRTINQVVFVHARHRLVGRNGENRQVVDLSEFGVFGHSRTGHARKLLVQAEVILQRDGGKRLILFAHLDVLFCFERLVQAFGETAAFHNAAGEFIDDLDFAIYHNIVLVAMEQELGTQRLLQMICQTT